MTESVDMQAELARWSTTGLPRDMMVDALEHLVAVANETLAEQRRCAAALRRELVYSLCWPQGMGEQSLVSRAYTLMGPGVFPIPGDPGPLRESLSFHEDKAAALATLVEHATALRRLIAG